MTLQSPKLFYTGSFEYPRGIVYQGKHQPMITMEEYDRVQALLGKRGRQRPQKHEFPFTGIIRCECGSMITAEEKTKHQKNGNSHHYIYYRCSKKKGQCSEKYLAAPEVERQVSELLSQLTIGDDFQKWALKYLHKVRTNEALTDQQIIKNRQAAYESVVKQLENLMLTFTSPENADHNLMTPAELSELKAGLLQKKAALETELKAQGEHINDWVELTEQTFNFARYASIWFEKGDLKTRKAIFAAIGSDFVLKDRKLRVELKKPFEVISKNIISLQSTFDLARTSESASRQRKNTSLDTDVVSWLGRQDSNLRPGD